MGDEKIYIFESTSGVIEMQRIEKIFIRKGENVFTFTGELRDLDDGWVEIRTARGEVEIYRREQVEGRKVIEEIETEAERNGRKRSVKH